MYYEKSWQRKRWTAAVDMVGSIFSLWLGCESKHHTSNGDTVVSVGILSSLNEAVNHVIAYQPQVLLEVENAKNFKKFGVWNIFLKYYRLPHYDTRENERLNSLGNVNRSGGT